MGDGTGYGIVDPDTGAFITKLEGDGDVKLGDSSGDLVQITGSVEITGAHLKLNGDSITAGGGGGISWDGSTANGVATYKDADEATVEANLTFDGSTLHVAATDGRVKVEATAGNHPGIEFAEAGTRKWIVYNDPDSDDNLEFKTDSNVRMVIEQDGNVGIGTQTPDYTLDVAGDIGVDQKIYHNGDGDTYINFTDNRIRFDAGGLNLFGMHKKGSAPHQVTVNNGGNNVDFAINDNSSDVYFRADASTSRIGIGTETPSVDLDVDGTVNATTYQIGGTAITSTAAELNKLDESTVSEASDGAWAVVERVAKATIDSNDWGTGLNSLGVTIPDNSIITRIIVDTTTTFVGGVPISEITLALYDGSTVLNELVGATMITDAGAEQAPYVAGVMDLSSALGIFKLTDDGELKLNVTAVGAALTAGVADIYIYYIIGA